MYFFHDAVWRSLAKTSEPVGGRLGRHLGRRHHRADLRRRRHVEAGFLERRRVGIAGQRLLGDLREDAQLAGAHLFAGFLRLDHHDVDVPAEQRGKPLAAAGERHERPLRAGVRLQRLADDVVARGDRAAGLLELAGLGACAASMKSLSVLYGESARTANTAGSSISCAIGFRSCTVTFASLDVSAVRDPHAGDQARSCADRPCFSAIAAAATAPLPPGLVDDLHAHRHELFLLHHRGHGAREQVAAAARTGMHDDFDRSWSVSTAPGAAR